MLLKTPGKLLVAQCHFLLLVAVCVIPVSKCNLPVGDLLYPVCCYRHLMRVPAQVLQYLGRAAKGSLGMYVPPYPSAPVRVLTKRKAQTLTRQRNK